MKLQKALQQAAPEEFLGLTTGTLSRMIGWSLTRRIEQYGVMPGSHAIIAWLMKLEDTTQSELSRLIGIEQPTIANTLGRLERDGLVVRQEDPSHGRRIRVRLSERGREISQLMTSAARELEQVATQGITDEDVALFFRTAQKMIENLEHERRSPRK